MEHDAFDFDYIEESEKETEPNPELVWNILTIAVLVMSLCVGIAFLTVLVKPNVGINPFPPPTMPEAMALDTLTPTPKQVFPPTWTPTPSTVPTATSTLEPTATLQAVSGVTATPDTPDTGSDESTEGGMPFVLHEGNPQYIPNLYHAELGCTWMGVGGQVLSLNGAPVSGVVVKLGGQLAGEVIDLVTVTGIATQYGPAGYEFDLTEYVEGPFATAQSLWVQLMDQAGLPMSDKIYFDTYEECDKSTIIVYFKQVE
ncbi:MAG: hypothetical protein U9Q82_01300 [Chloroflexota bacterium]|nr:hypothetical protein [Chloroflexota bacterium]